MYVGNLLVYTKNKSEQDKDMSLVIKRINKMLNNLQKLELTKKEKKDFDALFQTLDSKEFYYCASHPNIQVDWAHLNADYKRVDIEGINNKFKADIQTLLPLILPKNMNIDDVMNHSKNDEHTYYDSLEMEI